MLLHEFLQIRKLCLIIPESCVLLCQYFYKPNFAFSDTKVKIGEKITCSDRINKSIVLFYIYFFHMDLKNVLVPRYIYIFTMNENFFLLTS